VNIIAALHEEASKLESRLKAVRTAISALNGAISRKSATVETSKPRRTRSAAGRRAVQQASRKRWAAFRAEKSGKPKRTMSAATRRKISATMKRLRAAKS
jgi:hypothetical protein